MKTLCAVLVVLALSGCATVRPEPRLEFPEFPDDIRFRACETRNHIPMVCLTEPDAATLAKWFDKVKSFEEARARLLKY